VAVDAAGNIFIADSLNNRVRKVDGQTGLISTAVGTGLVGFGGDGGPPANALICMPRCVTFDKADNL
jgi:hypothetical protein